MSIVIDVLGWICAVLISIALAAAAVAWAADMCRRAMERYRWAIDTETRQSVGRSLAASGWWFSESPDTSLVVRIIGERLTKGESIDADSMREQWRKGRDSQGKEVKP